jgi:hypothetical protein
VRSGRNLGQGGRHGQQLKGAAMGRERKEPSAMEERWIWQAEARCGPMETMLGERTAGGAEGRGVGDGAETRHGWSR